MSSEVKRRPASQGARVMFPELFSAELKHAQLWAIWHDHDSNYAPAGSAWCEYLFRGRVIREVPRCMDCGTWTMHVIRAEDDTYRFGVAATCDCDFMNSETWTTLDGVDIFMSPSISLFDGRPDGCIRWTGSSYFINDPAFVTTPYWCGYLHGFMHVSEETITIAYSKSRFVKRSLYSPPGAHCERRIKPKALGSAWYFLDELCQDEYEFHQRMEQFKRQIADVYEFEHLTAGVQRLLFGYVF